MSSQYFNMKISVFVYFTAFATYLFQIKKDESGAWKTEEEAGDVCSIDVRDDRMYLARDWIALN